MRTCRLCHGDGALAYFENGKPVYWTCPACGGAGINVQSAPPTIGPGARMEGRSR